MNSKSSRFACRNFQKSNVNRRDLLRVGGAGMLGMTLPKILSAQDKLKEQEKASDSIHPKFTPKIKSVIFLFQWGGPSHLDTFDMKPDAPVEYRGPLKPIQSSVTGLPVCEHFPEMSKIMDKVCLIRSMTHTMNNHNSAGYYALTGSAPATDDQRLRDSIDLFPAYGSVIDRYAPNLNNMPSFVSYPYAIADGSITPGQHGSFLGKRHDPLFFKNDPNEKNFQLPQLTLPRNLSLDRLQTRRELQKIVDDQSRLMEISPKVKGFDQYYDRAINLLTSKSLRKAFDLDKEPNAIREAYGRTTYGQSCLLARRLVESGVKFVTVYFSNSIGGQKTDSGGWDTHGFNDTRMYDIIDKRHHPITDQTLPTLINDLENRGLLDETLVLWMGEFGRTPKINKNKSRDHWPKCYTALLAGAGVKSGYIHGASDRRGEYPALDPVRPDDLSATLYHLFGIDPETEVIDRNDRPLPISAGKVIHQILT